MAALEVIVKSTEPRLIRNTSTPESAEFWRRCEESAKEVEGWPEWQRRAAMAAVLGHDNEPMYGGTID